MNELEQLHDKLRFKVDKLLETEPENDEQREVRLMLLRDAYERYGIEADRIRRIK